MSNCPTVLCVDDEPNILAALRRTFRTAGLTVMTAQSGAAGLALLAEGPVDLVISDMRMPEMDGTEFLQHVREGWPDTVRLLLTGYSDVKSIIGAINRGEIYRYIAKPWDDQDILLIVKQALERKALEQEKRTLELLNAQQNEELKLLNASLETRVSERTVELQAANEKLKSNFVTSVKIFSTLIEMRGGGLAGHSRRVADLCKRLSLKMDVDHHTGQDIFIAALLHEIGKVSFSDELLRTPVANMTPVQLAAYTRHIEQAEHLLMPLTDLRNATDIICGQFEKFDGTGFPNHMAGSAISLGARILAVASDYDSMQIGTLTKRLLSPTDAQILISHSSGSRYDPDVVAALLELLRPSARLAGDAPSVAEKELLSGQLLAGMILSRDLLSPGGQLMLSADHALDARLIERIKSFERTKGAQLKIFVRA